MILDVSELAVILIDAGILSPDQVDVILMDQQHCDLKFGEIAVMRGWTTAETIEFIHRKSDRA